MRVTVESCTPAYLAALAMPAEMEVDTRPAVLGDPRAEAWLRDYVWALLAPHPIAAVGIWPRWDRVAYAFAWPTDEAIEHYGLSLTRITHHALRYAETQLGIRRLEAAVRFGDFRAEKWIQRLGFTRFEGVMKNYGPGAKGDFGLWVRLS